MWRQSECSGLPICCACERVRSSPHRASPPGFVLLFIGSSMSTGWGDVHDANVFSYLHGPSTVSNDLVPAMDGAGGVVVVEGLGIDEPSSKIPATRMGEDGRFRSTPTPARDKNSVLLGLNGLEYALMGTGGSHGEVPRHDPAGSTFGSAVDSMAERDRAEGYPCSRRESDSHHSHHALAGGWECARLSPFGDT